MRGKVEEPTITILHTAWVHRVPISPTQSESYQVTQVSARHSVGTRCSAKGHITGPYEDPKGHDRWDVPPSPRLTKTCR